MSILRNIGFSFVLLLPCLGGFCQKNINHDSDFSFSANYIYSMKWKHSWKYSIFDAFAYYVDVPPGHGGSIQVQWDYKIWGIFSHENISKDVLSVGVVSEFNYLPYSGLHYVDYEYLGSMNGLDQWLHHYDHDRYKFVYLIAGLHFRYEIKSIGYISFGKAYPIELVSSFHSQDLFINNKTGAFTYSDWEKGEAIRNRNPHIITDLIIAIRMTEKQYFTFGYQWYQRSSVDLNFTPVFIDNRQQAFRNVKIGWTIKL